MRVSLSSLVEKLHAGTATPEEQKQAAPVFHQMIQLGQAAMAFAGAVELILGQEPPKPEAPRPRILVPG